MITEQEKIEFIVKEGSRNTMKLKEFIDLQIRSFQESTKYKEMEKGDEYFRNETDIKGKKRYYIDENGNEVIAEHAQNFQLAHSLIYKIINQKAGYLLKKEPNIQQKDDKENENYSKIISDIFNKRMHKKLKRTLIEAVKKGIAWWQIYIDTDGKLKAKLRYATKIIPLWADDEHETLDAVILVYKLRNYLKNGKEEIVTKVEYWDLEGIRYYIYDGSTLLEDVEETEKKKALYLRKDDEDTSIFGHVLINNKPFVWTKMPFIYFKYNSDELSLIHYLKSLVDCYDKLSSKMADSIYEAPDGIDVVKNYWQGEIEKFKRYINTWGAVFLDKEGEYRRESVTIDINAFDVFIKQLRKDIYESGSAVDTQSEKFGTQQSGVAIQELYADLDLDCSNIETEFQASLEYFKFFIDTWAKVSNKGDFFEIELEYIFHKTMSVNEKELIENCRNSVGILSKKTILARHPYCNDLDKELEQIETEQKEEDAREDDYAKTFFKQHNNSGIIDNKDITKKEDGGIDE